MADSRFASNFGCRRTVQPPEPRQGPSPLRTDVFPPTLVLILLATAVLVVLRSDLPSAVLATSCVGLQVAACVAAWRAVGRLLSVVSLLLCSWFLYYIVRMAELIAAVDPVYDHRTVVAASVELRDEIWLGTTLGLIVLVIGMLIGRRGGRSGSLAELDVSTGILRLLGLGSLLGTFAISRLHLESGLLGNVAAVYVFAIAALSYRAAKQQRFSSFDIALVGLAASFGVVSSFKEPAIVACLAWLVGYLAAGRRLSKRVLALGAVLMLVFFTGIQAQRLRVVEGRDGSFASDVVAGFFQYDLATGARRDPGPLDVVTNPFTGVLQRVRGVDALFALRAQVPDQFPYQHGRTIIEPLVSTVPLLRGSLDLEYRQLSLGRFYNVQFWSDSPETDPSSQALTVVGDLFLNWGWAGVVGGLLLLGTVLGRLDRRFPATSAAGAGLFAYALIPLLVIERNLAYILLTVAIRLVVALVLCRLLTVRRRSTPVPKTTCPGSLVPR
jgi:hypothetical protein